MVLLSLLFGALVGVSLGLTGGGGAIFAVPLLVYGLGLAPRDAVAVSLSAVGFTASTGFLHRWRLGEVELRVGLLFAVAGMIGAPVGSYLAGLVPDAMLLIAFGVLMLVVASRLWRQSAQVEAPRAAPCDANGDDAGEGDLGEPGPACQRDASGSLRLNSRCAALLLTIGVLTGVLAGLFGVGGGFVIVPALVIYSRMPIQRAVGTSLMVIALVSFSGIISQFSAGRSIPMTVTGLFIVGGVGGLLAGQRIGRRLSSRHLQRVFAVAILAVAVFVISRNLLV